MGIEWFRVACGSINRHTGDPNCGAATEKYLQSDRVEGFRMIVSRAQPVIHGGGRRAFPAAFVEPSGGPS
jgi:hypothetical protein